MATPPPTPPRTTKIRKSLEVLGLILGPGILLEQVGHLLLPYLPFEQLPNIMFLAGCGLMVLLLWRGNIRFLLPYTPWLLCVILGGILLYNRLSDTQPPIVKWSEHVVRHAKDCKGKDKPGQDDAEKAEAAKVEAACVFKLMSSYKGGEEDFYSEQTAGSFLMASPAVYDALNLRFGIDKTFLGGGSSLPDFSGKDYSHAHLPEFLVPNLRDSDEQVWTWKLDPTLSNRGRLLEEILKDPPADWENRAKKFFPSGMPPGTKLTPLDVLQSRYKEQLTLNDPTPIVIRFGQFPEDNYHGYLGRPSRDFVFTSHLGEFLANHFTLQQAGSEAGFKFGPSKEKQLIFIWVFIPIKADEVVPASWHSVLGLSAKESESARTSEDHPAP